MKVVKFESKELAQEEADRLVVALGLPSGMIYGTPRQTQDGIWCLKVKETGSYPSNVAINGTIEEHDFTVEVDE